MSLTDPAETFERDLAAELHDADRWISASDAYADAAGPNPGHWWPNTDIANPQFDDPWQAQKGSAA